MADYFALIKKAVTRLDASARVEDRWALYERARAAQTTQLRTISPPLSEAEITREQLSLEEAVRRVEAEAGELVHDHRLPIMNDLVIAADNIGKPIVRAEHRSLDVQATPLTTIQLGPTMIVGGDASGRLIGYWRWRSRPSQRVAAANGR